MLTHQTKHAYKLQGPHYGRYVVHSMRQDDMVETRLGPVGLMVGDVGKADHGNGYSYRAVKSGTEVDGFKTRAAAIEALLVVTR